MWISLEITPNYSNSHDGNQTQKVIKISSSFKSNKWKTSGDKTKQNLASSYFGQLSRTQQSEHRNYPKRTEELWSFAPIPSGTRD